MMGIRTRINKIVFIGIISSLFTISCNGVKPKKNDKVGTTISTVEEFKQALLKGTKNLLVDDLDFSHETIVINRDIVIDAIDNESLIKNAYFVLSGPTVIGEKINVSFSNLIFDDSFDASNIDFTLEESFEEKFGSTRDNNICISGDSGYFSLSLDNCVIRNYASEVGAAISINNFNIEDNKEVSLNNCKIYNNYSAWDTLHFSHNKLIANITNSEFYANYAYKGAGFSIANGTVRIDRVNVHDNQFVPYDVNINDSQMAGGGIFLGGNDVKMTNSYIVNNKTTYGGGLAIATPYSGNKNVIIENVSIKNNEATYGGGIAIHSLAGQPATFINCEILGNKAKYGSSLYSEVYARWIASHNGGLIQFLFTTFALNSAEDNDSYSFYKKDDTKGDLGIISLKGCLSIGNDAYEYSAEDYNYIATKEQALLDGVINEETINNISDGLNVPKNSKANVKVSEDIYHKWSDALLDYSGNLNIGNNRIKTNSHKTPVTLIVATSISSVIIISLIAVFIVVLKRNKPKNSAEIPLNKEEKDMRKEYVASLSDREKTIVKMLMSGKKRKDIAIELHYSENTIKKDLTDIYSKLHVIDKYELMLQYKDLI